MYIKYARNVIYSYKYPKILVVFKWHSIFRYNDIYLFLNNALLYIYRGLINEINSSARKYRYFFYDPK